MPLGTLKVMREEQIEILLSLGVLDERADEFTAYMVWGKLLKDRIMQRKLALPTVTVVESMSKSERTALRERIFEACGFPKP